VVPVYGATELLEELVRRTQASLAAIAPAHEILLVDDGGPAAAWRTIAGCAARYSGVGGVRLARNVGQHPAIQAGLAQVRGQWVVVMDCDLQDPPEDIVALWNTAQHGGFDQVVAVRRRQDSWVARAGSVAFYQLLRGLTGQRHNPGVANFGIYRRWIIEAILAQRFALPFFPVQARLAGGTTGYVSVAHMPRPDDSSSYSLMRRVQLALRVLRSFGPAATPNTTLLPIYAIAEIIPPCVTE
jgi:glycosyltransferase involved in cell wall biosynthesis